MMHFSNEIWKNNTVEIMKHPGTNENSCNAVQQFAENVGMLPLPLYKEQSGYILNSLLNPFLVLPSDY